MTWRSRLGWRRWCTSWKRTKSAFAALQRQDVILRWFCSIRVYNVAPAGTRNEATIVRASRISLHFARLFRSGSLPPQVEPEEDEALEEQHAKDGSSYDARMASRPCERAWPRCNCTLWSSWNSSPSRTTVAHCGCRPSDMSKRIRKAGKKLPRSSPPCSCLGLCIGPWCKATDMH